MAAQPVLFGRMAKSQLKKDFIADFLRSSGSFMFTFSMVKASGELDTARQLTTAVWDNKPHSIHAPSVKFMSHASQIILKDGQIVETGLDATRKQIAFSITICVDDLIDDKTNLAIDSNGLVDINMRLRPGKFLEVERIQGIHADQNQRLEDVFFYQQRENIKRCPHIIIQIAGGNIRWNEKSESLVRQTLVNPKIATLPAFADRWITKWRDYLELEAAELQASNAVLRREDCIARLQQGGRKDQFLIQFKHGQTPQTWPLMPGAEVIMSGKGLFFESEAEKKEASTDVLGDGEDSAPRGIAAQVHRSASNIHTAMIDACSASQASNLAKLIGQEIPAITVALNDADPMADRISHALTLIRLATNWECGEAADYASLLEENPIVKCRNLISKIIYTHFADNFGGPKPSLPLKNGASRLQFPSSLKLDDSDLSSHRAFLNQVIESGPGGLAVNQGPPGSGKTTLDGKLAALHVMQVEMGKSTIVLTAHTNHAVQVLVEKTAEAFRSIGEDPKDHMVYYQTKSSQSRAGLHGKQLADVCKEVSLQNQLLRLANKRPARYATYLKVQKMGDVGVPEPLEKAYSSQLKQLEALVRETFKCFFCSIAGVNSVFFRGGEEMKGKGRFDCMTFVVDESSQCTWPEIMEAYFVLDPVRLVMTSDHKQLEPYASSGVAKDLCKVSPIEDLANRGFPLILLDQEFRSPWEIYMPISEGHYDGKVKAHKCTIGRESVRLLKERLARIELDTTGKGNWVRLGHIVAFFNITYGIETRKRPTSSSWNQAETMFVNRFCCALRDAGVSLTDILALTGYEAQYEQYVDSSKRLFHNELGAAKVDSAQGRQRSIVILSLSRTSTDRNHFDSDKRQNVACSRAQDGFFLVGQKANFQSRGPWAPYLQNLAIVSGDHKWSFDIFPGFSFRVDGKVVITGSVTRPSNFSAPVIEPSLTTTSAPVIEQSAADVPTAKAVVDPEVDELAGGFAALGEEKVEEKPVVEPKVAAQVESVVVPVAKLVAEPMAQPVAQSRVAVAEPVRALAQFVAAEPAVVGVELAAYAWREIAGPHR